ncbi:MAG: aminopeptidase P family protein [Bacteroidota bacterium]
MFSSATYQQRRKTLADSLSSGIIVLLANEESPMNYADNVYRYRQDSTFWYYLGLDGGGLGAIIDADAGTTTVFGDELSMDMIVWTGPLPSLASRCKQVGVAHIQPASDLDATIGAARAEGRTIHYLPPYRHDQVIRWHEWLGTPASQVVEKASKELIQAVIQQRMIKTEEEIEQLEIAVRTTNRMHLTGMKMARPGLVEAEIMASVRQVALAGNGDASFPIICTTHGQTLHNHHYHHTLESGQLLLLDAGAEAPSYYSGDMTRTVPVDKRFTQKQKEVYQIVLDANLAAIDALKPGVPYRDVHLLSAKVITEGLQALGLMKGDVAASVEAGAHALFFPHGLGHAMGLDVHDMENLGEDLVGYDAEFKRSSQFGLRSLRLGRRLEPGFVLTVEPGIYFIPELIDQWKANGTAADFVNFDALEPYKSFGGIRIEDDYLITENGARLLGDPVPKTVAEVEALRD